MQVDGVVALVLSNFNPCFFLKFSNFWKEFWVKYTNVVLSYFIFIISLSLTSVNEISLKRLSAVCLFLFGDIFDA